MSTGKVGRGVRPAADAELRVDMNALFGEPTSPDARSSPNELADRPMPDRPAQSRSRQRPIRVYGAVVTALVFVFAALALWSKGDGTLPAHRPTPSASEESQRTTAEIPIAVEAIESAPRDSFVALPSTGPLMQMVMTPDRAPTTQQPVALAAPVPVAEVSPPVQTASTPAITPPTEISPAPAPSPVLLPEPTPAPATAEATAIPTSAAATAIPAAAAARPESTLSAIAQPAPSYPPQALRERLSGRVVARLTIGTDGSVSDVQIESASPPRIFERAATAALRQWRYAPISTPQQTTVELDFKLEQ